MCEPREARRRAGGALGGGGRRRRRQRSKPNYSPLASGIMADNNFPPKPGMKKPQEASSSDTSPDSKCPICLDHFENIAYLDHCLHQFCFRCVQEWSKNKAECPLCKQPFHSIVHSKRSDDDYKVYMVRPSEANVFPNPDGRRFRYRTTMAHRRIAAVFPRRDWPSHTASASQAAPVSQAAPGTQTAPPPDHGVLFEGLSAQARLQRDEEITQMIRRLQNRRQANSEGRSTRQIQEQEIVNFRRALYRSGTRVRSIEDGGRYRDISAEFFRSNPACLHRLVPWLKRELTVLFGAHGSLVSIVQHIIMSNVTRYDLESPSFADDLKPFLLHRTEHFLHELISFARCPFNIDAYDQHANYDCPAPSYEEGTHSESSIITISPDDVGLLEAERDTFSTGIGRAPWDDETPGPSYLTTVQGGRFPPTTLVTSESSDEEPLASTAGSRAQLPAGGGMNDDSSDSSDNCLIVGYVKPLAERTPELVQLSSDSDESLDDVRGHRLKRARPLQYRSFSDTDASGYASPFSVWSRDDGASYAGNAAASSETQPQRTDPDPNEAAQPAWAPDSPAQGEDEEPGLAGGRESESKARDPARERHSLKRKRKHHSTEKHKKKRDGSKHKHKKEKKKSRARDKGLSGKSHALSRSSESTESREQSWSRPQSREYGRSSRSQENDRPYGGGRQSRHHWEWAAYNRNTPRDGWEPSYRRWSPYSRPPLSPEHALGSFSEQRPSRSPRARSRSRYSPYENHRSRSRSGSRSRASPRGCDRSRSEKPGGKRKYKTRHLERSPRENGETFGPKEAAASSSRKPSPKRQEAPKRASSFLDSPREAGSPERKKPKASRSPSVEIVFETKGRDAIRRQKKREREKKHQRKSPAVSPRAASPVVITIDSDSDQGPEFQDFVDWDRGLAWSPAAPQYDEEGDSPSPFAETRDASCDGASEGAPADKDGLGDETPDTTVPLVGREDGLTPARESSASADPGQELSDVDTEPFSQLSTSQTSLQFKLGDEPTEHFHPLDSP